MANLFQYVESKENGLKKAECFACYKPFDNAAHGPIEVACGHLFGRTCIGKWLLHSNDCPHCRTQLFAEYGMKNHYPIAYLIPTTGAGLSDQGIQGHAMTLWTRLTQNLEGWVGSFTYDLWQNVWDELKPDAGANVGTASLNDEEKMLTNLSFAVYSSVGYSWGR